jgi:signal transduction histidine kinase
VLAIAGIASTNALGDEVNDSLEGIWFAWLFLTYSMAARVEGRRLLAGVLVSVAGTVLLVVTGPPDLPDLFFGLLLFVAGPVAAGRLLRSRVRLAAALREKAEREERERVVRAEEAAADERARIAGELHDVVAHALGAMTIQAAAARRLSAKDATRAAGAFEAIEATGREALGELRTLLEVLRAGEEEEEPAREPQPGMAALGSLVARTRAAGLPVELEVHGQAAALPTGIDLTAYRVVQEALAAALERGGAGHARVVVRHREDRLDIDISDDGSRVDDRPLLGMRERVRLYGGEIEAGPRRDGGHHVRAHLPLERVPA